LSSAPKHSTTASCPDNAIDVSHRVGPAAADAGGRAQAQDAIGIKKSRPDRDHCRGIRRRACPKDDAKGSSIWSRTLKRVVFARKRPMRGAVGVDQAGRAAGLPNRKIRSAPIFVSGPTGPSARPKSQKHSLRPPLGRRTESVFDMSRNTWNGHTVGPRLIRAPPGYGRLSTQGRPVDSRRPNQPILICVVLLDE